MILPARTVAPTACPSWSFREVRQNTQPTCGRLHGASGDDPRTTAQSSFRGLCRRLIADSAFCQPLSGYILVSPEIMGFSGLTLWGPRRARLGQPQPVRGKRKAKVRGQSLAELPAHSQNAGRRRSGRLSNRIRSDRADLLSLRTLRALACGELDALVLLQAAETVGLDGGVVYEDVGGAVIRGDETIALVSVEPLHGALSHVLFSYGNDYRDPRTCLPGCCDSLPLDGGALCDPRPRRTNSPVPTRSRTSATTTDH